jgi:hypothetical protein
MSKKKFLFFCLISIFYMSCTNCEKLNLSAEEKDWVNQYKIGQQFIYKNEAGQVDTITVKDTSNKYTPCNQVELSKYQYEIYSVIFKLRSQNIYNNDEPSITMTTQEWKQRIPYIYFGNLGLHRNDLQNRMPIKIDTVLSGVKLTSVYYYSKELNTEQYGEKEFFKNFFWSKQSGLVAYTTLKGEIFLRINE